MAKNRRSKNTDSGSAKPVAAVPLPSEEIQNPKSKIQNRHDWLILLLILLVGLCLRGIYLHEIINEPDFKHPHMDPQYNDYWARAMITGNWTPPEGYPDPEIRTTPHGRPPGYPYFLAFIYLISGCSYLAPRLVQMGLGLANAVLLYYLARAVFGRRTGLIAAAFMATYWVFIHFEGELTYPAVAVFVLLLFFHAIRFWLKRPRFSVAFLSGLLFGIFALFRPNGLLFAPLLLVWMGWVLRAKAVKAPIGQIGPIGRIGRIFPRAMRRAFVFSSFLVFAGVMTAIGPAFIRNYVVAHDFVFLSSYGGVNLWAGNNANADGVTPKIPNLKKIAGFEDWSCFHYPTIVRGVGRLLGKENIKFSEASKYFYDQGIDFITHHPLKTLQLFITKTLIFWGPIETTNDKVLHWAKRMSPLLRILPGFPFVLSLFVVGLILFIRNKGLQPLVEEPRVFAFEERPLAVLFLVFVFTYYVSVAIYFVAGRYRIPVIPFLLIFGAYGVDRMIALIAARQFASAGKFAAVGVAAFVVGSIQFVSYKPDLAIWHHQRAKAFDDCGDDDSAIAEVRTELEVTPTFAEGHNFLARLLAKKGQSAEAVAEYNEALKLDPSNEVALNNLGDEMAKEGRLDEAIKLTQAAIQANPQFVLAHNNLGNLLSKQGKFNEAITQYQEALRLDPDDRFADYNLGNALAAAGKVDEALKHYARAAQIDPRNPDIPNNMGLALAQQGKSKEAIGCYDKALALDPDYANAHNNIGYELAKQNDLAQARKHYEEALRLNPNFPLALNNLGNLLARQGNDDDALTQYAKALELEPKNADADNNIGDIFMKRRNWQEAERHYRAALASNPANADAANNLANALTRQSRFVEARESYKQALKINPRYIAALINLGTLAEAAKQYGEALEYYKEAIKADPNNADARKGLDHVQGLR